MSIRERQHSRVRRAISTLPDLPMSEVRAVNSCPRNLPFTVIKGSTQKPSAVNVNLTVTLSPTW